MGCWNKIFFFSRFRVPKIPPSTWGAWCRHSRNGCSQCLTSHSHRHLMTGFQNHPKNQDPMASHVRPSHRERHPLRNKPYKKFRWNTPQKAELWKSAFYAEIKKYDHCYNCCLEILPCAILQLTRSSHHLLGRGGHAPVLVPLRCVKCAIHSLAHRWNLAWLGGDSHLDKKEFRKTCTYTYTYVYIFSYT